MGVLKLEHNKISVHNKIKDERKLKEGIKETGNETQNKL